MWIRMILGLGLALGLLALGACSEGEDHVED